MRTFGAYSLVGRRDVLIGHVWRQDVAVVTVPEVGWFLDQRRPCGYPSPVQVARVTLEPPYLRLAAVVREELR